MENRLIWWYLSSMHGNFFYQKLGKNLAFFRKKNNLSQEELSVLAHIDRTYIARIEEGKANPTVKILFKISRSLHVALAELVRGL